MSTASLTSNPEVGGGVPGQHRSDGLSAIDANSRTSGNNAFTFIGEAAFGRLAGQLRYRNVGEDTLLGGDVDGDGRADFHVLIVGSVEMQIADVML